MATRRAQMVFGQFWFRDVWLPPYQTFVRATEATRRAEARWMEETVEPLGDGDTASAFHERVRATRDANRTAVRVFHAAVGATVRAAHAMLHTPGPPMPPPRGSRGITPPAEPLPPHCAEIGAMIRAALVLDPDARARTDELAALLRPGGAAPLMSSQELLPVLPATP